MTTKELSYQHGDVELKAFVAYKEDGTEQKPGVLVSHAWGGRDQFACDQAVKLAERGYVGFALDMYGGAKLGQGTDECSQLMTPFMENRALVAERMSLALNTLRELPNVNASQCAAIGFCFGGLCVLDLARSGSDINGVVSFHGLLPPTGLEVKEISAKVLTLHGYDDPMAKPEDAVAFGNEMTAAKADWQMIMYGQTMHAFTNPEANDPGFGTVFSPSANDRSFMAMGNFLNEVFSA